MRPEVLLASVLWEDIDSITKSKNMLNQFLYYNGTAIPPNLREVKKSTLKLILTTNYSKIPFSLSRNRSFIRVQYYQVNTFTGNIVGNVSLHFKEHPKVM